MNFSSVGRKASGAVLVASLAGGALLGAASVGAQAPTLPSLFIINSIAGADGAAITSGTVAASIGGTQCVSKSFTPGQTALDVGQPNQPAACQVSSGTVSFTVNGQPAGPDGSMNPGVPQNVSLKITTATPAPPAPKPAATGNGGLLDVDGATAGAGALAGMLALAALGGTVAVRRVRS